MRAKKDKTVADCTFCIHISLLAQVDAIVSAIDPESAGQKYRGKYSKASRSQVLCKLLREALEAREAQFTPKKPAPEPLAA
ncbi:hypothetical protein QUA41_28555 [Microcoleus sp. Pol11C1]|uniref:hypothetical protein n=1 Tax=unclassified Microcoleus TaxID=2642155 RepID=UPI002FD05549